MAWFFPKPCDAKAKKVVFASSGCVYPNFLQSDVNKMVYLTEDLTNGPNDADNTYGWAKLMAEFTLKAYHKEHGLGAASCRYFTVYGPRGVENHAVIAMIARAFIHQTPFEVWGDGTQIRNWTYIDDIVEGTILAGEKINDGTAVNLGTMERITGARCGAHGLRIHRTQSRNQAAQGHAHWPAEPRGRQCAGQETARLGAESGLQDGLKRTIDWYFADQGSRGSKTDLRPHANRTIN